MTPSQRSIDADLLETPWHPTSSEGRARAQNPTNHSAPIVSYESTHGICNELARLATNRSAVMQIYDSMFPPPGAFRATVVRRPSPQRPRSGRSPLP